MLSLSPSQKGAVAEAGVAALAAQLGLTVLRPLCEGRRYDLVLDLEPQLMRVQCKLARVLDNVLVVCLQSNRCTPRGYVSRAYSTAEIDAVCVYAARLHRCFLLPVGEVSDRRAIHLRIEPTKNNQARRIKWASEYELATMVERLRAPDQPHCARSPARLGYRWGYSSAGRALPWHGRGRRFEPD